MGLTRHQIMLMVQKSFSQTKRQTIQQLEKLDSTTRQNPASNSAANTNNKEEEPEPTTEYWLLREVPNSHNRIPTGYILFLVNLSQSRSLSSFQYSCLKQLIVKPWQICVLKTNCSISSSSTVPDRVSGYQNL